MRTTITIDDGAATRSPGQAGDQAGDQVTTAQQPAGDESPAPEDAGAFDAPQAADPGARPGADGADGGVVDAGVVDPELVEVIEAARQAGLDGGLVLEEQPGYDVDDLVDIVDAGGAPG